jgi:hypothetical protein
MVKMLEMYETTLYTLTGHVAEFSRDGNDVSVCTQLNISDQKRTHHSALRTLFWSVLSGEGWVPPKGLQMPSTLLSHSRNVSACNEGEYDRYLLSILY